MITSPQTMDYDLLHIITTFGHTHFIFKSSAIIYEFEYIDRDIIKPLVLNQILVFYPLINEEVPSQGFWILFLHLMMCLKPILPTTTMH